MTSRPVHRASRRAAVVVNKPKRPARAQEERATRRPARADSSATRQTAAPVSPGLETPGSSLSAFTVVLAPLIGIALLLLAAASISPALLPWPGVAASLQAHRSDLALFAFGAAGVAFVMFCVLLIGL
ncbi:MAG: hypothetical protein H0V79_01660 [Actinobacteria bacterium]|nr:hypothetical protein [Actinomycetota bacterium]